MNKTTTHYQAASAWLRALSLLLLAAVAALFTAPVFAQDVNFAKPSAVRVTVPLNTTNTTVITNIVEIAEVTSDVVLDISGLPAGASYALSTNNLQTNADLAITIYTTNIAQGEYTFSLNATGGATNNLLFVLQAGYVWAGAGQLAAANWTNNTSWQGGSNPTNDPAADVIFGSVGAQTNLFANGITFTNILLDQSMTVGSLRFAQGAFTNSETTNTTYHHVRLANNVTLSVTGTKGFRLLRDYLGYDVGDGATLLADRTGGIFVSGGAGSRLVVTNAAADFALLYDGDTGTARKFLNMSNLLFFSAAVNRMGLGEYQLYPNYYNYVASNGMADGIPRRFTATVYLARTNFITAGFKGPDNYTNELTRAYAISYQNSQRFGVGSSVENFIFFGTTNRILADSICLVGANHANGNNGFIKFNPGFNNSGAVFRGTNGTNRMTLFAVADDGGPGEASSNVKATVDFAANGGFVDILADTLIVSRDRTLISSNQTPNVQGDLTIGRGLVDVNTMILGYQEHDGKTNWTAIGGAQPYLNYCQGRLIVTNGGTVKVNGLLTLGYTADSNPTAVAQQYSTHGRLTIHPGSTLIASNIVVDGGPFNYDPDLYSTPRTDFISVNSGTLIVTNSVGAAPGRALNELSLNSATNVIFVNPSRTNFIVKTLVTSGSTPSVLRVVGLTGVSSFPAQIPVIKYTTAGSPFLAADVSAMTGTYPGLQGYVLNNTANGTIDLYLTTNAPKTLLWTGSVNDRWDNSTANWIPLGGGSATSFSIGDIVVFDDTSTRTNVDVFEQVVPNQAAVGVTISNNVRQYTFSGAGAVTGTGSLRKQGSNLLTLNATKEGGVLVAEGTLEGTGTIGTVTVFSNAVVNYSGNINGGLNSTGAVTIASGGQINGPTTIAAGWLNNVGTISTTPGSFVFTSGNLTNSGTMNIANATYAVNAGSTFANFGTVNHLNNRVNLSGFMFGTGTFADPNGGLVQTIDGRVDIRPATGVLSPGATPIGSIGTLTVSTRFDISGANNGGFGTLLIEVDKAHAQTNDIIAVDFWNNMQGRIIITNINPGAGLFANGDVFHILQNNNGFEFQNPADTAGDHPIMEPPVPGPGLQWDLSEFRYFGKIKVRNTPMVWRGNVNGNWDISTANWLSSITYTNGAGALFDDSVGAGATTVSLTGVVAPAGYTITTNIDVGVSTNLFTNGVVASPGIVVSNSAVNYTLGGSGSIEGWSGLYKTGPGTLTIAGNMTNRFTGGVIIEQGKVVVSVFTNNSTPGPLGAPGLNSRAPNGAERLIFKGGSLDFVGNSMQSDRGMTIYPPGVVFSVSNATSTLLLSGTILGDGGFTKTGAGVMALSQSGNAYTNLTLNQGTLELRAAAAGRGHLILSGGHLRLTNNVSMTNLMNFVVDTVIHNTNHSSGATVLGGSWTGAGDVTITNDGPSVLAWTRDMANFTGDITVVGSGRFRFNNSTNDNDSRGGAATIFDLGNGSARLENHNGGGLVYDLGGLVGGSGTVLAGRFSNTVVAAASTIYGIGAKGSDTVFNGTIINGQDVVSVVKVGAGKLTLNGVNTYTGPTTVSNGTLAGSATFAGSLSVVAGATLAPGSSVGTMTVNSNVTLAGTTLMELDRVGAVSSSDRLVANAITAGGSLIVTNIGPTIANGATFQLFSVPVSGFSSITLPGAPYVWQTNLAVNGSITMVSGGTNVVDTTPTNITSSLAGNTLTLSWPSSHTGWSLQVQTNTAAVGISTNWIVVSGSAATNQVNITINPANPTVFFRLVYP